MDDGRTKKKESLFALWKACLEEQQNRRRKRDQNRPMGTAELD
jgi:hypothetical protein